jgi:hypothetical protein
MYKVEFGVFLQRIIRKIFLAIHNHQPFINLLHLRSKHIAYNGL